jgi:hypothetical protein
VSNPLYDRFPETHWELDQTSGALIGMEPRSSKLARASRILILFGRPEQRSKDPYLFSED